MRGTLAKRILAKRILVVTVAGVSVGLLAARVLASDDPPPPPGLQPDGTLDVSQMPDCIPVGRGDGTDEIAGCVDRDLLFAPPTAPPPINKQATNQQAEAGFPVKDEAGEIVGYYIPDVGFVEEG